MNGSKFMQNPEDMAERFMYLPHFHCGLPFEMPSIACASGPWTRICVCFELACTTYIVATLDYVLSNDSPFTVGDAVSRSSISRGNHPAWDKGTKFGMVREPSALLNLRGRTQLIPPPRNSNTNV